MHVRGEEVGVEGNGHVLVHRRQKRCKNVGEKGCGNRMETWKITSGGGCGWRVNRGERWCVRG